LAEDLLSDCFACVTEAATEEVIEQIVEAAAKPPHAGYRFGIYPYLGSLRPHQGLPSIEDALGQLHSPPLDAVRPSERPILDRHGSSDSSSSIFYSFNV
jgi:hypothetical protein